MLTKQQRYSFKNGVPVKSVSNQYFVLRYEKSEYFMCGVVVSKKIQSSSVDRNKIKRQFKRILSKLINEHQINYSLVFYIRKKSIDIADEALHETLTQLFKKEGIISQ
jgi:ribonuclease P protein component